MVALALVVAGGGVYLATSEDDAPSGPVPAPQVVVAEVPAPAEAEDLGFPAFATKNTTRVGGSDPVANAAGVARDLSVDRRFALATP